MWVQKLIWFLGRMIFYMLLLPLLIGMIYTLAHGQLLAALIFLILFVLVFYFGLIRVRIPAHSVVVRNGKVVFFIPETTVRDRFDFVSRGQTIVELPSYGLLDRPYRIELFSSGNGGGVSSCRLSLTLSYIMELTGWQRAYDNFVRYQDQLPFAVKRQLFNSSAQMVWRSSHQGEEDVNEYLKPIVAELNLGLGTLGLKIAAATCTFNAGPTLARLVADEQEIVEKPV